MRRLVMILDFVLRTTSLIIGNKLVVVFRFSHSEATEGFKFAQVLFEVYLRFVTKSVLLRELVVCEWVFCRTWTCLKISNTLKH